MKENVIYAGLGVCLVALFLGFFVLLHGCDTPAPRDPSVVSAGRDMAVCSVTAQSWPEYDACRDNVRRRYDRLDGGKHD